MPKQPSSQSGSLRSLITLMSDPDPRVGQSIEEQLVKRGEETRDLLRETEARGESALVRIRAREVLDKIHEAAVTDRFRLWVNPGGPDPDLEEGWFLLTQLEFPDLDVDHCRRKLDGMAAELDPMLRGARDLEGLRIFQNYLNRKEAFRGNVEAYYEPDNSYINSVLDRRLGIPISLCCVYLLIARRVGLPLEGISGPGHFLLRYRRDRTGREPVYIDAFHGGRHFDRKECVAFLRSIGHSVRHEIERPAASREILARMCRNLIAIYRSAGPVQKSERLIKWLDIINAEIRGSGGFAMRPR
ncbi:MAG: transglutaminase family protein [Nitrospinota bacterium]